MAGTAVSTKLEAFRALVNRKDNVSLIMASCGDKDTAKKFMSSMLDLYGEGGSYLQGCDSQAIIAECLKAAQLNLPIINSLGYAYIVPYKGVPTFTIGWRGMVQLAQNTGKYRYINADVVYEGEEVDFDRLSGTIEITGTRTSDKAIGYFAYIQLLNGFEKTVYMTREQMEAYKDRYAAAKKKDGTIVGPWVDNFDAMAKKTVLKKVLKYGPASTQMTEVEDNEVRSAQAVAQNQINASANTGDVIDVQEPAPVENSNAEETSNTAEEKVEEAAPQPAF